MARRRSEAEGILDLVAELPWWVGVTLAVVLYTALRFVVPQMHFNDIFLKGAAPLAPQYAWLAWIFLLPAGVSALRSMLGRQRTAKVPAPGRRCPRCGGEMVVRTARRGERAGNAFYGCTNFPRCRYTEPISA